MEERSEPMALGNKPSLGTAGGFERKFVSLLTEHYSGSPISVAPEVRMPLRDKTRLFVDCALFSQGDAKPIALFEVKQKYSYPSLARCIEFFQAVKCYGIDNDAKYYFVRPAHSESHSQSKPFDASDVVIYDITQAVIDNKVPTEDDFLRNQVSIYALPSPSSAERSYTLSKEREWDKGNEIAKVLCWAVIPAIALALVILDRFDLFSLSWQNLSVLGFAACCALLPSMRYIKIGTFETSLSSRKKEDKEQNQ